MITSKEILWQMAMKSKFYFLTPYDFRDVYIKIKDDFHKYYHALQPFSMCE